MNSFPLLMRISLFKFVTSTSNFQNKTPDITPFFPGVKRSRSLPPVEEEEGEGEDEESPEHPENLEDPTNQTPARSPEFLLSLRITQEIYDLFKIKFVFSVCF